MIPVLIGKLGAVTPKLKEWLWQISGTASEKTVVLESDDAERTGLW